MPQTVHGLDQEGKQPPPPLVGALLRRPYLVVRAHIVRRLQAAGYTDFLPAHMAVFQYPGPHGRSPSDIARASSSSKQAINNLLTQLEKSGYLTREPNPDNRRERVVLLTSRGHGLIPIIRGAVTELEDEWCAQLGERGYEQLRTLLRKLNAAL
jgi:DNA-binding MarR family transcriptional regulator